MTKDTADRIKKGSTYIIQKVEGSYCPYCQLPVNLLCKVSLTERNFNPAFYICWGCNTVAQVGVGPVKRELDNINSSYA